MGLRELLTMVTLFGMPVSSTHAINGAIIGAGATRGKNAVNRDAVREIVTAWIIIIPLAFDSGFVGYSLPAASLPRLS